MKYGIKVITDHDASAAGYTKTIRGWECWCRKDVSNLNEAFRLLNNWVNLNDYRYIVDEDKE